MIYRAFIRVYCQIHSKCYGCSEFRLRISGRSIVRSIQLASHNIKINFSNYILMYFAAQNSFIFNNCNKISQISYNSLCICFIYRPLCFLFNFIFFAFMYFFLLSQYNKVHVMYAQLMSEMQNTAPLCFRVC